MDVGLFSRDLLNDAGSISDYRTSNYEMIFEHDCGRLGVDVKISGTDCMMGRWVYE